MRISEFEAQAGIIAGLTRPAWQRAAPRRRVRPSLIQRALRWIFPNR